MERGTVRSTVSSTVDIGSNNSGGTRARMNDGNGEGRFLYDNDWRRKKAKKARELRLATLEAAVRVRDEAGLHEVIIGAEEWQALIQDGLTGDEFAIFMKRHAAIWIGLLLITRNGEYSHHRRIVSLSHFVCIRCLRLNGLTPAGVSTVAQLAKLYSSLSIDADDRQITVNRAPRVIHPLLDAMCDGVQLEKLDLICCRSLDDETSRSIGQLRCKEIMFWTCSFSDVGQTFMETLSLSSNRAILQKLSFNRTSIADIRGSRDKQAIAPRIFANDSMENAPEQQTQDWFFGAVRACEHLRELVVTGMFDRSAWRRLLLGILQTRSLTHARLRRSPKLGEDSGEAEGIHDIDIDNDIIPPFDKAIMDAFRRNTWLLQLRQKQLPPAAQQFLRNIEQRNSSALQARALVTAIESGTIGVSVLARVLSQNCCLGQHPTSVYDLLCRYHHMICQRRQS